MGTLRLYWNYLRSSLWFVPFWITLGSIVLAVAAIELDKRLHEKLITSWPRLFAAEPQGTQAMLSAIAASMITVAGVVFSITILALAQASTQYSPRVLRNFMTDHRNQVVLGVFVGVFSYCLVILRNIAWENEARPIPSLAVFIAFLFALIAIGFLIYFIHHIAESIQASSMTHSITTETLHVIKKLYPDPRCASEPPAQEEPDRLAGDGNYQPVPSLSFGYIQAIEEKSLLRVACERRGTWRMDVGVGEFVIVGRPLGSICGCKPDEKLVRQINRCYAIDAHRTIDQDPAFGVQQLSDIAVKALSPGINDTTTAITAVDYLSQILSTLATRDLGKFRHLEGGEVRLISRTLTFGSIANLALQSIIENAGGNEAVIARLLVLLRRVAEGDLPPEHSKALLSYANAIAEIIPSMKTSVAKSKLSEDLRRTLIAIKNGGSAADNAA